MFLLKIIYFVVVVLVLFNLTIFIHELGHYLVGKWRGAKIERFAIWFGPALWSKTINGVEYRLGCIPLGGYVAFPQLAMEAVEGKSEIPKEELPPLKPVDKIPILFAGSVFNIILGFIIAAIVWIVGLPKDAANFDLTVGYVAPNTPERAAGMEPGDTIVSINGKSVQTWEDVVQKVALSLSEKIKIGLSRNGQIRTVEMVPSQDNLFHIRKLRVEHAHVPIAKRIRPNSPAEKAGIKPGDAFIEIAGQKVLGGMHVLELTENYGNKPMPMVFMRDGQRIELTSIPKYEKETRKPRIGVEFDPEQRAERKVVYPSAWTQVTRSLLLMADTLNALLHTRTTGVGLKDLAGPLGIAENLYFRIEMDFRLALEFLVILNINLAVVNLLPIPVLDGGHIVFSIIEAIRRKPLSQKLMEMTQTVFIVLLLVFMAYVTLNDAKRSRRFGMFSGGGKDSGNSSLPAFEEIAPPAESQPTK